MTRVMSARERRLVALLVLTALIAAVYLLLVAPIVAGFASRAERREQSGLRYVHNLRTIASIPRLRRAAEQQRGAVDLFVVDARSIEAAREQVKDRLQRAIESAGGAFVEGADAEGRPVWARVRGVARMTLPQVTGALARLQNEPPWLVVETVGITANDALVTGQSSAMDIEIEISLPIRPAAAR